MNQELLKKTANDPSTNSGDLEALIGKGDVLEALLAKHPNATAEMLRKLSQSKSQITCRNVVLNPNIPRDVLIGMASRFPGDFFKNPMFDWILLEDPDLIERLKKEGVLENTLKRIDCPESFLRAAAKSGNFQDRLSATMNPSLPGELLAILAEKDDLIGTLAREVVAGRRNLLTRLLDIRYPDGESCNEESVLDHILQNPNCGDVPRNEASM